MLEYFKKWFAPARQANPRARHARPTLESLETRDVPNAGPGFFAHGFNFGPPALFGAAAGQSPVSSGVLQAVSGAGHMEALVATLTGVTGASGKATFTPGSSGQNTFTLSGSGLTASQTYDVEVGGTSVGQVSTDSSGGGSVTLSNLTAAVAAGSVVSVVDTSTTPSTIVLSGTFAADGCHHDHGQELSASLTGTAGAGSARFSSGEDSLRVRVSGLTANATYTVEVSNGTAAPTTVGQITTDAEGNGRLSVSNLTATITSGTVLTVLDANGTTELTGTFAASSHTRRG
jgi:hypothetical protein